MEVEEAAPEEAAPEEAAPEDAAPEEAASATEKTSYNWSKLKVVRVSPSFITLLLLTYGGIFFSGCRLEKRSYETAPVECW